MIPNKNHHNIETFIETTRNRDEDKLVHKHIQKSAKSIRKLNYSEDVITKADKWLLNVKDYIKEYEKNSNSTK